MQANTSTSGSRHSVTQLVLTKIVAADVVRLQVSMSVILMHLDPQYNGWPLSHNGEDLLAIATVALSGPAFECMCSLNTGTGHQKNIHYTWIHASYYRFELFHRVTSGRLITLKDFPYSPAVSMACPSTLGSLLNKRVPRTVRSLGRRVRSISSIHDILAANCDIIMLW